MGGVNRAGLHVPGGREEGGGGELVRGKIRSLGGREG